MIIEVEIAGCPNINLNSRVHHFKQASEMKKWKFYSFAGFKMATPIGHTPFNKAKISIIRYFSGKNKYRDYDNLVACMKPIIDGAKLAGVISDDNYQVTGSWEVSQVRTEKKDYVSIKIEGVNDQV